MNELVSSILIPTAAMAVVYILWVTAHLLARRRFGDRKLGCRGPTLDDKGNEICCHTGAFCEHGSESAATQAYHATPE